MPIREWSECGQEGGIPGILIGLVDVLNAAADITQPVIGVVQVIGDADAQTGRRRRTVGILVW
jgi:hypothetical protein